MRRTVHLMVHDEPKGWRRWVSRRLRKFRPEALARRGRRYVQRARQWSARRRVPRTMSNHPVFVFGSNRSGTQMVCEAIGRSIHGWDYREGEFTIAFNGYYLRADWLIERLIRRAPAPIVSFGSILDSQFADDLLGRYDGAQALWVYRRYSDAANSSIRQWGSHFKDLARWVSRGELERLGARGSRVTPDTVQLFAGLFREELSYEDGACLYWYLRNRIFFDLRLDEDPRVLLVQYEDAVLQPERAFRRIFGFLGVPYEPAVVEGVFATSVGKHRWPGIDAKVQEVCDALQARLDAHYAESVGWKPAINAS